MPELPEVETIRLGLQKYLVGHRIEEIDLRLPKQFIGDPSQVVGATVIAVRRFGKGLVIDLDNHISLAIHVKMTGQLLYASSHTQNTSISATLRTYSGGVPLTDLPDRYTHVLFTLDKGSMLYYRDIRQFGWIKVVPTAQVIEMPFFKMLGKEPLRDLTFADFVKLLKPTKTPIKTLLMDQAKIAGIGNIYANDALFQAGILPTRPANTLSRKEQEKLFAAIEELLAKSIAVGGASASNYINVLGERGTYQDHFLVYKRDGKQCIVCTTVIERSVLGGRGTFICHVCQI